MIANSRLRALGRYSDMEKSGFLVSYNCFVCLVLCSFVWLVHHYIVWLVGKKLISGSVVGDDKVCDVGDNPLSHLTAKRVKDVKKSRVRAARFSIFIQHPIPSSSSLFIAHIHIIHIEH